MANFDPRFVALTGTPEQIKGAEQSYRVFAAKVPIKDADGKDTGDYTITHSGFLYLMDRDGQYLAHFSKDATADDLNHATIFATVGTDALYVGSEKPFKGVFVKMLDSVSSVTGTLTVQYWSGTWEATAIADRTSVNGKTFAAGGSVTWQQPTDWQPRVVNSSESLYWVKLTVSATPTGAKASQIGVIRASMLRAPATFRTLQLIYQEARTGADGPWVEKAKTYEAEAEAAFERALPIIGGEFDTDGSDLVSEAESEHTAEQVGGGAFTLERA